MQWFAHTIYTLYMLLILNYFHLISREVSAWFSLSTDLTFAAPCLPNVENSAESVEIEEGIVAPFPATEDTATDREAL